MNRPDMVALIPARAGSKRVPGKNVRLLAGHPLLAYAVRGALDSGVFTEAVVSTESPEVAELARRYGASVPFLRPEAFAGDLSPDIEWVAFTLAGLEQAGRRPEAFAILRPTSPFRTPDTLRRAFAAFCADPGADSLRAMEPCRQHPGKMWVVRHGRALPLLPLSPEQRPWHSRPYQDLPLVHVQNASLEMAHCRVVSATGTIAGSTVLPFFTVGLEGFDINTPEDWELAEAHLRAGRATLPDLGPVTP